MTVEAGEPAIFKKSFTHFVQDPSHYATATQKVPSAGHGKGHVVATGGGTWEGDLADVAENVLGIHTVLARPVAQDRFTHLALELHDGVAGELATMLLDLERFRHEQVGRQGVLAEIGHLQDQVRMVLSNVRALLYDERELPQVDPDFVGSLRRGLVRRFARRTGLRIRLWVSAGWPEILPAETARNLHRIVQEALNNVDRHSGASTVLIRLGMTEHLGEPLLTIMDDGRGYPDLDDGFVVGLGLVGIQERAALLGAKVLVSNRRRGGGALSVLLPRRSVAL